MMHGHEKSRLAIVAVKPANKVAPSIAEQSAKELAAAESGEPRARAEGECEPAKHVPDAVPGKRDTCAGALRHYQCRLDPRWEPYAGKSHVRICAGGREVTRVPTATQLSFFRNCSECLLLARTDEPARCETASAFRTIAEVGRKAAVAISP